MFTEIFTGAFGGGVSEGEALDDSKAKYSR